MKLLIIDDDLEIANFLKNSLKSESYEVDVANNGEKGSFMARTNDYDLVILDNALPEKSGREVCRDIRKDGIEVPILMLSVQDDSEIKAELLNIGADDYLAKPFSFKELLARVKALLRRPREIKQDVYVIDDLEIDTKKKTVVRGGKEIYLTLKEYMLLEFLIKNKGSVVSRGMILEHVWDMNADMFSNTIEAHISNLRKKIDIVDKMSLIHTIPGRGYKIDLS